MVRTMDLSSSYVVLSFLDGRECVPRWVADRTDVLKRYHRCTATGTTPAECLPRELLQTWSLHLQSKANLDHSVTQLCSLLKAADFLADESCVQSTAAALGQQLPQEASETTEVQALDSLSSDQALAVLRASHRPMMELFLYLPVAYHRLALLVHAPTIETTQSLDIQMSDPHTTVAAIRAAASFPTLTALTFRPTLGPDLLLQALVDMRKLRNLLALELSGTHMSSSLCITIARRLRYLSQLQSLNLDQCGICGTTSGDIFPVLAALSSLQCLSLDGNELNADATRMLASHFQHLQTLTKLSVAHAMLTDVAAAPLIAKLSQLKGLQVLDVSHNCLNDDFAPHPLAGYSFATSRDRPQGNPPDPDVLSRLLQALYKLPKFQELIMDQTWLSLHAGPARPNARGRGFLDILRKDLRPFNRAMNVQLINIQQMVAQCEAPLDFSEPSASKTSGTGGSRGKKARGKKSQSITNTSAGSIAPHLTSLTMAVFAPMEAVPGQCATLAAILAKMSALRTLEFEFGGNISNAEVAPVATCLRLLSNLEALTWFAAESTGIARAGDERLRRPMRGGRCSYAESFAQSLHEMGSHLKSVRLDISLDDSSEASSVASALGSLSHLSCLALNAATDPLVARVAPLLPSRHLVEIRISARGQNVVSQNRIQNVTLAFAKNAKHLTALTYLLLDAEGCGGGAVGHLAKLIQKNTGLGQLVLVLTGCAAASRAAHVSGTAAMTNAEQTALCDALSGLSSIKKVSLKFDRWYDNACNALVCARTPDASGNGVPMHMNTEQSSRALLGKHVRALKFVEFGAAPAPTSMHTAAEPVFGPGGVAMHAVANLPALVTLQCQYMHFAEAHIRPLQSVSCMPNLTGFQLIEVSMSLAAATAFARAIGGIKLPGLWTMRVQIDPPSGANHDWNSCVEQAGDAALCVIVENLPELPSLQELTLGSEVGVPDSFRMRTTNAERAQRFGIAISRTLASSSQLKLICIQTHDLPESVSYFAETLGKLRCLASLRLMDSLVGPLGACAISQHLNGHTALADVVFCNSFIGDRGAKALAKWFRTLPVLCTVSFGGMHYQKSGWEAMQACMSSLHEKVLFNLD